MKHAKTLLRRPQTSTISKVKTEKTFFQLHRLLFSGSLSNHQTIDLDLSLAGLQFPQPVLPKAPVAQC